MRKTWFGFAALFCAVAGGGACNSSGTVEASSDGGSDAGVLDVITFDGPTLFDTGAPGDSATPSEGGEAEAGAPPSRLLLSYNPETGTQSELVAFGLASKAVDGDLIYTDPLGTAYVGATAPWLLEQSTDMVARLDAEKPWVIDSSWNVAMNDVTDAGYAQNYSDPQAVIVGAGSKAYVLRYTRNLIAIIDTSTTVDAGLPLAPPIDLSSEIQAAGDGYVQPVAGIYVAAQQRLYVLLGNVDRFKVADDGYVLVCAATTPTVVAIDTTSNTLIDLNGTAPGNGWPLVGYNPILGPGALAYDPTTGPSGRLLVLEAGCNVADSAVDGGVGALVKREIESVDLSSGAAAELLDLTAQSFPQGLTYIDAHHAIVQLDTAYAWDPTTATLGTSIPNAPDSFVYDGAGNLLGVTANYASDGGLEGYDVVSVTVAGGTVTKLGSNPFTLTGGFLGGVSLWPAP